MKNIINNKKIIIGISIIIMVIGIIVFYFAKDKDDDSLNIEQTEPAKEVAVQETNKEEEKIYIHIIGEVNNPGVIQLEKGNRIVDAIEKAGGVTEKADLSKINLAFVLSDGQKVRIPNVNDQEEEEYITQNSGNNIVINEQNYNLKTGGGKVNINTATQTELETLTGIGPSLAARILDYRNKNGKFKKIDELRNVKGIGQSKYDGIKDEVVVD